MTTALLSREQVDAEAEALAASLMPASHKRRHAAFVSCLRPPGLFQFGTEFCGFTDAGRFHERMCAEADAATGWHLWLVSRGHFKSSFLTIARALLDALYYWPNQDDIVAAGGERKPPPEVYIMSWSLGLASEFVQACRTICDRTDMRERFAHAIPERPKTWTTTDLVFANGASIHACTLNSLPTGGHATRILADDLETLETINTPELRAGTVEKFRQLYSILNPDCPFWVVGTRYHHADLYASLTASPNWRAFVQPCFDASGQPVFPERFSRETLRKIEQEQGPYTFSCQYLLNPVVADEQVFRPEWVLMDAPDRVDGATVTLCVDPAISERENACFTGISVVASASRGGSVHRYLIHRIRQRMNPSQIVDAILSLAVLYGVAEIGIESIQYQAAIAHFLEIEMRKRGRYYPVTEIKSYQGRSKHDRIKSLQPEFSRGLYHLKPEHEDVRQELLDFPVGKTVDVIDSMAMHQELECYSHPAGDALAALAVQQMGDMSGTGRGGGLIRQTQEMSGRDAALAALSGLGGDTWGM